MSLAALDRLLAGATALNDALDRDDLPGLTIALVEFGDAVEAVKAVAGWRETPDLLRKLAEALAFADAARVRVNFLTDRARRRLELLGVTAGTAPRAALYSREGRLRA
jgi:hypothetical protein